MNALKPFFLLIQRPLVLFGAIGWMIIATFLISALVRQGGDPEMYMDASFLTVVILSAFAGWLIGSCILELHQTSFAVVLPTVRTGLLPGFLLFAGCVVFAAVLPTASASPAPQNSWLLFVMGLGAYATGASIRDPQSGLLTGLGTALLLVLLVTSGVQASLAGERPLLVVLLAGGLFALGLFRLFGQDQLRSRSLNRGRPVLMFSAEKLGQAQQKREMAYGPTKSRWRQGYLGIKTGNWLKAAWHESYGGRKNRTLLKSIGASWGLILILLIEARETFDELGAWKSICWVIHDGLMRSPYPPLTGEHTGAFIMVSVLIVIAGASIALWRPVALAEAMLYPLSRRQKADLLFSGSFLDMAILLFAVAPVMFVLGHLTGIFAGVQPRFDYMPFFMRVMLVTLIMMPLAYWGRLRLRSATWQRDSYSMVGVSFGMAIFSVVAILLVFLSDLVFSLSILFRSALVELVVLTVFLLISRVLYLKGLRVHYRTTDFCG